MQLSVATLKRLRKTEGGPPFSRYGAREIRYKRSKLDAWMESREGGSDEDFKPYKPAVVGSRRP